jgi:hypothetical protein
MQIWLDIHKSTENKMDWVYCKNGYRNDGEKNNGVETRAVRRIGRPGLRWMTPEWVWEKLRYRIGVI